MAFSRLSKTEMEKFVGLPEDGPGFHVAMINDEPVIIVGCQVMRTFEPSGFPDEYDLPSWSSDKTAAQSSEARSTAFESWRGNLPEAKPTTMMSTWNDWLELYWRLRGFTPVGPGPWVWPRGLPGGVLPPPGYGHLPFATVTAGADVFYRFEPFPISLRIDQTTLEVVPETFASPISEISLVPTGFAAVARYALPSLFPACYRWELQPLARTRIACGSVVPFYGQSGGGVEVCFEVGMTNRCPIADPVILPVL